MCDVSDSHFRSFITMMINTMVFLEDADMCVRLLRLFSLNEISSSLWKKTLPDVPSVKEKFFLLMRKIFETE